MLQLCVPQGAAGQDAESPSGVCCLNRTRSDARQLVADPESPLHEYAANIVLVQDPIVNEISSTKVRGELAQARRGPPLCFGAVMAVARGLETGVVRLQGHSVRYLTPDAVIAYIHEHGLYRSRGQPP